MQHSIIESYRGRLQQRVEQARAHGADAAKISLAHNETSNCRFESNKLKSARAAESMSYRVEVLVGGRIGCTSGNRQDALGELVDGAVTLAREGKHAHFTAYPGPAPVHPVRMHSLATLELSRQQRKSEDDDRTGCENVSPHQGQAMLTIATGGKQKALGDVRTRWHTAVLIPGLNRFAQPSVT